MHFKSFGKIKDDKGEKSIESTLKAIEARKPGSSGR
jgi:hypothetical protein